jgi:hypothetical protein
LRIKAIVSQTFEGLCGIKFQIFISLLQVYNRGNFRERVIYVIDFREEIGLVAVEYNKESLVLQRVHLELIVSLDILQKIFIFNSEAVSALLNYQYYVGREDND